MPSQVPRRIAENIAHVVKGQDGTLRKIVSAWVCGLHVLLDDYPGTGKTTLAKALARTVEADFQRLQFTPDLLPSDITGVSIFDTRNQSFTFHPGPVFTHVLLADEINRASPRTQSALLEAMAESQVTVDGVRRSLPDPYFVIATQNPVESHGTYPLPEAQLDRFGIRLQLGYVSAEDECALLDYAASAHPVDSLRACTALDELKAARVACAAIHVSDALRLYIVALVQATRKHPAVMMGASPRASLALFQLARALALFDGEDYVTPDHIQELAEDVLAHRLAIEPQARLRGTDATQVVHDILASTPLPG